MCVKDVSGQTATSDSRAGPRRHQFLWLEKLHEEHQSGLISVSIAGHVSLSDQQMGTNSHGSSQVIISISDPVALDLLFRKHGTKYSDRGVGPFLTRYVSKGAFMMFGKADEPWKVSCIVQARSAVA